MTDARSSGEPGGRDEMSLATNAHCDINWVVGLGMLASTNADPSILTCT